MSLKKRVLKSREEYVECIKCGKKTSKIETSASNWMYHKGYICPTCQGLSEGVTIILFPCPYSAKV